MVNGDVEAGQSLPIEINSTESELCDYTLNDINSITNSGEIYVLSNSNDTPEGDLSLGYYITDVAIKSSDGALYEKIPANGNFDAEVNFNTIYDSIEDVIPATMVVAAYTGSGVLISISTVPINEEKANNGFCTLHVDATDKDIASLKLFVWSSFNSLIPLSDVVRITN